MEDEKGRFRTHGYKDAGDSVHQAGGKAGLKFGVEVPEGERSGAILSEEKTAVR